MGCCTVIPLEIIKDSSAQRTRVILGACNLSQERPNDSVENSNHLCFANKQGYRNYSDRTVKHDRHTIN